MITKNFASNRFDPPLFSYVDSLFESLNSAFTQIVTVYFSLKLKRKDFYCAPNYALLPNLQPDDDLKLCIVYNPISTLQNDKAQSSALEEIYLRYNFQNFLYIS